MLFWRRKASLHVLPSVHRYKDINRHFCFFSFIDSLPSSLLLSCLPSPLPFALWGGLFLMSAPGKGLRSPLLRLLSMAGPGVSCPVLSAFSPLLETICHQACDLPCGWRGMYVYPLLLLLLLSSYNRVRLCATPWTAAYQASPSMGFSRQEHWSGLPFPSPMHESGK